jgi:hypothetical protein
MLIMSAKLAARTTWKSITAELAGDGVTEIAVMAGLVPAIHV